MVTRQRMGGDYSEPTGNALKVVVSSTTMHGFTIASTVTAIINATNAIRPGLPKETTRGST